MSIAAAGPADYGMMTSLIADNAAIKTRLDQLTIQISSGLVGNTYASLGANAATSLNLNPQITELQTWQNNINQASSSMQVTQTAMTQLQQIAASFVAQTANLEGSDSAEVDSVAAQARQALVQVGELLDTQDGNAYVFSGIDSANPPVPDPDQILSSGFYTQINAQVTSLGSVPESTIFSAVVGIGMDNTAGASPFSTYLSQSAASLQAPVIQTGHGQTATVGLLASANLAASPTPTATSTGSYMRDLMMALATIGSMSSGQTTDSDFTTLVQDTNTTLTNVVGAMAEDAGVLGNTQSNLATARTTMADTATALTTQVSNVQDVDMAQAMTSLTLVQTQLQASYQVIAGTSGLSLAKFLPAG